MAAPPLSAERVCAGDLTARGSFRHYLIQDLRGDRATNRPYPSHRAAPQSQELEADRDWGRRIGGVSCVGNWLGHPYAARHVSKTRRQNGLQPTLQGVLGKVGER